MFTRLSNRETQPIEAKPGEQERHERHCVLRIKLRMQFFGCDLFVSKPLLSLGIYLDLWLLSCVVLRVKSTFSAQTFFHAGGM